MPITEACMAGIEANGLKWKTHGPMIGELAKEIGTFRDMAKNGELEFDRFNHVTAAVQMIGKRVEAWADQLTGDVKDDFDMRIEDMVEFLQDFNMELDLRDGHFDDPADAIEEIVGQMNDLYDFFDYHRILVR